MHTKSSKTSDIKKEQLKRKSSSEQKKEKSVSPHKNHKNKSVENKSDNQSQKFVSKLSNSRRRNSSDSSNVYNKTSKIKEELMSDSSGPDNSPMNSPNYDDLADDISDLDDHDTYEECLKIFNEYVPEPVNQNFETNKKMHEHKVAVEDNMSFGKKRIAHGSNYNAPAAPKFVPHVRSKISASEAMHNRFVQTQQAAREANLIASSQSQNAIQTSPSKPGIVSKKRIAHVPNVSALLQAAQNLKNKLNNTKGPSTSSQSNSTISQTIPKGAKRMAHTPTVTTLARPTVPSEYGSKVPSNIRQRYLNLFIDECLKIYDNEQDAYDRGLAEEKSAYDRSANRTVYLNVVVNSIKKLRNEQESHISSPPVTSKKEIELSLGHTSNRLVSHEFVLGGRQAATTSYSIERPKKKSSDIAGAALYRLLKAYLLTQSQLEELNYPLPHPTENGRAIVNFNDKKLKVSSMLQRTCVRCNTKYKVSAKGIYETLDECVYHYGKSWRKRIPGGFENRYNCCGGDMLTDGCCVGKLHVSDYIEPDSFKGYVKTLPTSPPMDGNYGVYALDCEMCYTVMGMELTRITVVGSNLKTVFETLVKPDNEIVDYNTQFSGITESDLERVSTTIRDVQAVLLNKFNDQTILVGHSLDSDLRALKIIHKTVVDTSIVFPHKNGLPFRRALRNLVGEYLQKIIQNSVGGHDSQEDAVSCMELMLWKLKDDAKKLVL